MAAKELTVKQLLMEIEAENNATDDLKSVRQQTIELANDTDELIGQMKKGDAQFAAVAASLEKITDRQLRAKEAVKAHNRAFRKQTGILAKLGDKMNVARARLDSMGAAGQVLKAGMASLAATAVALGAAVIKLATEAIKALIDSTEESKAAADNLKKAYNDLLIVWGQAITGSKDLTDSLIVNEARLSALTATVDGSTSSWGFWATALRGAGVAFDLAFDTDKMLEVNAALKETMDLVTESTDKAKASAKGQVQFSKDLQAAKRDQFAQELAEDAAREKAATASAAAAEKRRAQEKAAFGKFLVGLATASKNAQTNAEKQLAESKRLSDERLMILRDEQAEKSRILSAAVSDALTGDAQSDRLVRLTKLQNDFTGAQQNSQKQAQANAAALASLGNSFVSMAEGLATGELGLKEAAKSMGSAFGDILIQLGSGIVLASEALIALFSGNAALGLTAGLALVAGGIAIKAALGAGSASGGFASSSAAAPAPTFETSVNDFQRREVEETERTVNVYIGQEQIRGPLQSVTQDMVRRGQVGLGSAFS